MGNAKQFVSRRSWRCVEALFLGVWVACFATQSVLGQVASPEYRLKAIYLNKLPSFVQWPEGTFARGPGVFQLCVYGNYAFGFAPAQEAGNAAVAGRKIEVHAINKEEEMGSCQLLFVARSEAKRYAKVLEAVKGTSALTVGETSDFLDAGGIVELTYESDRVLIKVNLVAARTAGLTVDARLLAIAKRVVTGGNGKVLKHGGRYGRLPYKTNWARASKK